MLLDTLGYHLPYNETYRKVIQELEGPWDGTLLQVRIRIRKEEETERWWKKPIAVVRKKRRKPAIIVIDNKAWQVKRCEQRYTTNPRDGDARVVLGCAYLLTKEYESALEYLKTVDNAMYTVFTLRDIYEFRGFAFYNLARRAQKKKDNDAYLNFIEREQKVYLSALEDTMDIEYFRYLYGLTFIELGLFLEKQESEGAPLSVTMPKVRRLQTSQDAYIKALEVLVQLSRMDSRIFQRRAFVYTKLGKPEKAAQERELQGRAAKMSIFEKERKSVREKIFHELKSSTLFKTAFIKEYIRPIDVVYTGSSKKTTVNLDSIIQQHCDTVTANTIRAYPEIKKLTETSREHLVEEIGFHIHKTVTDSLNNLKKDYLWTLISKKIRKEDYATAFKLIDAYGILIAKKDKLEELAMLRKSLKEIWDEELEKERKSREKKKKEILKVVKADAEKDSFVKREPEPEVGKKEPAVSLPQQIGTLIDDLIAKGEFIAAYRGVKAYEKLLKDNFDSNKIDTIIEDLEELIVRDHGKKHLRKLQKELKY
jgi:tetratricopeptide (TPR) repeat protein